MKVKVRFVGSLARRFGKEEYLDFRGHTTLGEALDHIFKTKGLGGLGERRQRSLSGYAQVFLNGRRVEMDTLLKEGDEITFFPVITGG